MSTLPAAWNVNATAPEARSPLFRKRAGDGPSATDDAGATRLESAAIVAAAVDTCVGTGVPTEGRSTVVEAGAPAPGTELAEHAASPAAMAERNVRRVTDDIPPVKQMSNW